MPGKRTPADPLNTDVNVHDTNPQAAAIQNPAPKTGGQYRQGEAPPENAYREKPTEQ